MRRTIGYTPSATATPTSAIIQPSPKGVRHGAKPPEPVGRSRGATRNVTDLPSLSVTSNSSPWPGTRSAVPAPICLSCASSTTTLRGTGASRSRSASAASRTIQLAISVRMTTPPTTASQMRTYRWRE